MIFNSYSEVIYHCYNLIVAELEKRGITAYQSSVVKGSRVVMCKLSNDAELILTSTPVPSGDPADYYGIIHYDCNGKKTFLLTYFIDTDKLVIDDFLNYLDNPYYKKTCSIM